MTEPTEPTTDDATIDESTDEPVEAAAGTDGDTDDDGGRYRPPARELVAEVLDELVDQAGDAPLELTDTQLRWLARTDPAEPGEPVWASFLDLLVAGHDRPGVLATVSGPDDPPASRRGGLRAIFDLDGTRLAVARGDVTRLTLDHDLDVWMVTTTPQVLSDPRVTAAAAGLAGVPGVHDEAFGGSQLAVTAPIRQLPDPAALHLLSTVAAVADELGAEVTAHLQPAWSQGLLSRAATTWVRALTGRDHPVRMVDFGARPTGLPAWLAKVERTIADQRADEDAHGDDQPTRDDWRAGRRWRHFTFCGWHTRHDDALVGELPLRCRGMARAAGWEVEDTVVPDPAPATHAPSWGNPGGVALCDTHVADADAAGYEVVRDPSRTGLVDDHPLHTADLAEA